VPAETILQRVATGEEAAVDECVREYGGLVWRLAKKHLDHAPGEVEDAVQDVFLELWLSAGRFDPSKGREASFVATIAHRRLIDRQREITTRRKHHRKAAALDHAPRLSDDIRGVSTEDQVRLAVAFNGLPEAERDALWMSVYRGLSHREIGLATELPIGTVKSRLRRAMIRLTEILAKPSAGMKGEAS